ncbi:MAG TPA: lipid-A-disaccharide synthase [Sedimentisphaerales bacterium]|nr:lipid-A-disaccharide synthase [Sedimentisphaerales bacterium]
MTSGHRPSVERPHFFLSAAEPSADVHCRHLIEELRKLHPQARFTGIGGAEMERVGCRLLVNTAARAAMTYNVLGQIGWYRGVIRQTADAVKAACPDLVIVCDSPALNFHIAKAAKAAGSRTLFYVAPQLWAWGTWRIRKLRRLCDKLCCILPFEEQWFAKRGIDAAYVGNPLLANLNPPALVSRPSPLVPSVALMPGSRKAEVDTLWEPMQEVAVAIKAKFTGAKFTAVAVDVEMAEVLKSRQVKGLEIEYSIRSVYETAAASDFSLVASGSATLQVAAAGCPMAVMYQSSRILWHLMGRWLIRIPFLSLPNILAGKELVPEFMPYFSSAKPIAKVCIDLLDDPERLEWIRAELLKLTQPLAEKNAPQATAAIASSMLR